MAGKKLITIDGSDCIVLHSIPLHRGLRTKYNDGSTKNRSCDSHHHHCIIDGGGGGGGGVVVLVSREIQ